MRKTLALLALLSLLAPLAALAAPSSEGNLKASIAISQVLSPQEMQTGASPSLQLDAFFQSLRSGSSDQLPLGGICDISCRPCTVTCPPGEGFCRNIHCA